MKTATEKWIFPFFAACLVSAVGALPIFAQEKEEPTELPAPVEETEEPVLPSAFPSGAVSGTMG